MFQLPTLDSSIPCELVPQASRRRGALFARTLLRAGAFDASLMPARIGSDHIKTCQEVLGRWMARELSGLRILSPQFSMRLRDADERDGRGMRPACVIEWGGQSFGVRCVGPALEHLEKRRAKLGKTVLEALEHVAWRTLPIYTPNIVMECASDTYWYGELDEESALEENCGDDAEQREEMRKSMVTRAMFDAVFPSWALGGGAKPLGRRTLLQLAAETKERRIAEVIEAVLKLMAADLPNNDWAFRDGRFVGFSGVLAWNTNDELTLRVLDDYEQMIGESGDYFESCGEDTVDANDPAVFREWFAYMRKWCDAVRALDDLIWKLTEGDWPGMKRGRR